MDKSKKEHSKLIIACSDPAENFKFLEETLNQVTLLIGVEIAEPRLDHITFGWDRIRCSLLCDVSANGICSVCFITQNGGFEAPWNHLWTSWPQVERLPDRR